MAGTSVPSTTSTSMTAYYGPIAPPLDLSLFENGTSDTDLLTPFLRLGKLSSNSNDKESHHYLGNHKHDTNHSEHEDHDYDHNYHYDLEHEDDNDDDHLSSQFASQHFDSDDSEEGGEQSDQMGILICYMIPIRKHAS